MMCDFSTQAIYDLRINFNMKISRNWLQKYFDSTLPSAQELADLFTFHSFEVEEVTQVEDDWVIDVDILPNRSSDCLSHRGIAREISTLLSIPLKSDPLRDTLPAWKPLTHTKVSVENNALCPRYMAALIRGVRVEPSPPWLQKALKTLGQKSINNIVDATNYVMHDVGQPLHAFDYSLLATDEEGTRHLSVRLSKKGEEITTLTGDTYTLGDTHQLIADGVSGLPLALAGIKGGKVAEVTEGTVDVILESANFNFVNVRKTSNELKLATDASVRFQNEPSPLLPAFAMRDLIRLIEDVSEGELVGVIDEFTGVGERIPVTVTLSEINSLLGTNLSVTDVEGILVRFEWEFSRDAEEFAVTSAWERSDVTIKEAIIEEIGRVYGYSNISSQMVPTLSSKPPVNKNQYYIEKIQKTLLDMGYSEVLTYTLAERGEVELLNPLASDKAFMRRNIADGLLKALELNVQNAPLLSLEAVKLFELGTVFTTEGEEISLAIGGRAVSGKQRVIDGILQSDIEKVLEMVGSPEKVVLEDGIFEISLKNIFALLPDVEAYESGLSWNTHARYTRWSSYPFVLRDISVWVPKAVSSEEVLASIMKDATELLVRHTQFDEFEKDEKISYAWHLVFQSYEKTLTDVEINAIMAKITENIQSHSGWEVR
ncbi:MAG: Phenylalanine-tRNA ligase beta subunit [Parcubacteria group bacterium GW2011_GWD2_42_14]|nr:MAG: Phenylalanine-tRNA ligase beta subunit [Parcubacteria group bacterium GW2011_GWD2_42_14]